MDARSQKAKIIQYCAKNGSITIREAFEELNINSPTKRISELRRLGYDVHDITETRRNAAGEEVRYKRYYITRSENCG